MPTPKRVKYPAIPAGAHGTGPWGVSDAPMGHVEMNVEGGGSFSAPMGSSEADEAARFREYANLHLRQQYPEEVRMYFQGCAEKGVEQDIAEAVFMAAVNGFAGKKGVKIEQLPYAATADHGTEYLVKAYLHTIGTAWATPISQWLAHRSQPVWQMVSQAALFGHGVGAQAAVGTPLRYKELFQQAYKVQQAFGRARAAEAFENLPKTGAASDLTPEERERLNNEAARCLSKMKGWSNAERNAVLKSLWGDPSGATLIQQIQELQAKVDAGNAANGLRWGLMHKRLLRMTRRAVRHSFRHRPTFMGAFRYPHRALIPAMDGRAWHAKLVGLGGTVLLDHSGSMGLNEEQVRELLHRSPLATIACYSGGDQRDSSGMSMGHLTILAKEGRYAAENVWPAMPGGNVVDGPALRWLAKQARPRVWISDGNVTASAPGGEQNASADMRLECALVCRMAGITQYHNIEAYLESHHYMSQFK